jgi:hypothetical protein
LSNWSGHWHGYGPWTGSRKEYGQEDLRMPGPAPSGSFLQAFLNSTLPPLQSGHALLRVNQTTGDRTWTALADALTWLGNTYTRHPPMGAVGLDLEGKLAYSKDFLGRGSDDSWAYYTANYSYVSFQVVSCPNRFLRTIPCPRPPA